MVESYRKYIRTSGGVSILMALLQKRDEASPEELDLTSRVLSRIVSDGVAVFLFVFSNPITHSHISIKNIFPLLLTILKF